MLEAVLIAVGALDVITLGALFAAYFTGWECERDE